MKYRQVFKQFIVVAMAICGFGALFVGCLGNTGVEEQQVGEKQVIMYNPFDSRLQIYDEQIEDLMAIHDIYIYCQSIKDVEAIAGKLNTPTYSLSYTLQDFDDLVGSTFKSVKLLLLLSLVAYGIAIAVLLANIYGHFRNMAKDMGILRHMGFSIIEVQKYIVKP